MPTIEPPSEAEMQAIAESYHFELSDEELGVFSEIIPQALALVEDIDRIPDPHTPLSYPTRGGGYQPDEAEDSHNAFITKCNIQGADDGPLAGYEIGVKDNISVAGVRMTCGSNTLLDYVPQHDATVITRLLDAGATITGKTNMEELALSGSGELSAFGPVLNPRDTDHLSGGSSSGSGAAVAAGDVNVSLGTDQGGSVRIPAAWCGVVGLKPTSGLVPYTGSMSLGHTFDHIGPLARDVIDCARTLEVMAGEDPLDPRQGVVTVDDYVDAVDSVGSDIDATIGVVEEGFSTETTTTFENDSDVGGIVLDALDRFDGAGAQTETVSVPWHLHGQAVRRPINIEGTAALVRDEGVGHFVEGHYDTQFVQAFGKGRRAFADDFIPTVKLTLVLGGYLEEKYMGYYYAKAQNLRRELRRAYDEALEDYDALAMPTAPNVAPETREEAPLAERIERAQNMSKNTAPFNISGHPAITVPCGTIDGLPVGLMLIGDRGADARVLSVAESFTRTVDWNDVGS